MSRGKNDKNTKVAVSKLVLGAKFLFTTFSFDLILAAQVFYVALHQNFWIWLFHLERHSFYICGTTHKIIKALVTAKQKNSNYVMDN